jgi:hypothetical protein
MKSWMKPVAGDFCRLPHFRPTLQRFHPPEIAL